MKSPKQKNRTLASRHSMSRRGFRLLSVVLGLFAATGWQVGCRTAPAPAPLRFEATAPAGLGQPLSFNDDDFVYALALGHQEPLVAYAHHVYDDQELSLASWGESAYLWRAPLHRSEFDCLDMTFAPDDLEVAAASTDGALRLYPVQERGEPKIFFEGEPLTRVAFAPDGRHLAVGSSDGFVRLLSRETLQVVAQTRITKEMIRGLAFETNDRLLVVDDNARLTRLQRAQAAPEHFAMRFAPLPEGQVLFVTYTTQGAVRTGWNMKANLPVVRAALASNVTEETVSVRGQEANVGELAVLNLGPQRYEHVRVAVCDACLPNDLDLMLPDLRPWGLQVKLNASNQLAHFTVRSSDEKGLAAPNRRPVFGGFDLLKIGDFKLPGPATDLAIRPDAGEALVTYSHEPAFRSPQVYEAEQNGLLPEPSASSGALLIDLNTWTRQRTFVGHRGFTVTGAISPDGRWVVTGGWDGSVLLFDATTGQLKTTYRQAGHLSKVRFSTDNRVLGVGLWSPGSVVQQKPALLVYPVHQGP